MQTLQFTVDANPAGPIKRVDLFILSEEEPEVPSPNNRNEVDTWQYPEDTAPSDAVLTFDWDTTVRTPYNGKYTVLVTAETHGQHPNGPNIDSEARRDLRVDNPPKALAAPRIIATTPTTVSVEWDAASEPDVVSYDLYRASANRADKPPDHPGDFEFVRTVPKTENETPGTRDEVKQGNYWYSVVVTRRSVETPETGIKSAPSPTSKVAEVKPAEEVDDAGGGGGEAPKPTFVPRVVSRLPRLAVPSARSGSPPPVPDAPFSAVLPYDLPEGAEVPEQDEPGGGDPRGPVLPVAVGAFLVSSALTLGRMPY